ncbi:uncharacterized protein LOC134448545 [Engraulis encrasicolus]|uniref:uncharacterized protein LOC134448545 n=1 Tax=Engraulis encrasicolus TaxID=184585 RepID=UPI002FD01CE8
MSELHYYSSTADTSSCFRVSGMQSEEEARAIETAVRAAVLSVVDVINNIYTSRLVDYQRKVTEKDNENALLKAEVSRAEKELAFLRGKADSQQDEDVRFPSTDVVLDLELHENPFIVATHRPTKHATTTGPLQSNVKQSKRLSAAERQRRYRARRDADPRRRAEYLERHKQKWMNDKLLGKAKRIDEYSPKEKLAIRKRWRLAQEKSRASKVSKQLQVALNPEQSPPQYPGANTEFQYECLSLDTFPSSPRDVDTGSPESPSPDTVYIKCEVKEENTSDFLEDMSTDQYHSDPHSSWTLERETPENYSFTHHHPSEVQTHTRSPSRREKEKHDVI